MGPASVIGWLDQLGDTHPAAEQAYGHNRGREDDRQNDRPGQRFQNLAAARHPLLSSRRDDVRKVGKDADVAVEGNAVGS